MLLFLARYAHLIPRAILYPLARALGSSVMAISPRHRRIVMSNLRLAFGAEKSEAELRVIARRFYQNFAKGLFEFLRMPAMTREEIKATARLEGEEHLQQAMAAGRGAILISAHYGNWETAAAYFAISGYGPLNAIARSQRDQEVTELLTSVRTYGGLRLVPREGAIRECTDRLAHNELVGIMIDQNAGDHGVFVEFFGKLASTAAGAAVLAIRTESPVIAAFCVRQPDETQKCIILPPLRIQRTGDVESDVVANTAVFTRIVEQAVREHPDHWFWLHRRWKARPPWERGKSEWD